MRKEPGQISSTERRQLIALIKLHFSVLRKEVDAEEKRLMAEVDTRVAQHVHEVSKQAEQIRKNIKKIVAAANIALQAQIEAFPDLFEGPQAKWHLPHPIYAPYVSRKQTDDAEMRRAMMAQIRARTEGARLKIQRDQVERLRELHVDALVSDTAQEIAKALPSLRDLIPADTLELVS